MAAKLDFTSDIAFDEDEQFDERVLLTPSVKIHATHVAVSPSEEVEEFKKDAMIYNENFEKIKMNRTELKKLLVESLKRQSDLEYKLGDAREKLVRTNIKLNNEVKKRTKLEITNRKLRRMVNGAKLQQKYKTKKVTKPSIWGRGPAKNPNWYEPSIKIYLDDDEKIN